jgi:subtilisin-like proprotein convertase family protein
MRGYLYLLAVTATVAACTESKQQGPDVINPDSQDISAPLRELVKLVPPEDPDEEDLDRDRDREAEPWRVIPHRGGAFKTSAPDPVVQFAPGEAQIPTPIANFEGMGSGLAGFQVQSAPPDTDGDIGPNHYVQIVNSGLTVFNRSGQPVLGPMPTRTIFNGFAGPCGATNDGDGTVRYDRLADRWVIAQFSISQGQFLQCVAVSTTADPTGSYARYAFSYTAFNDYPKFALWPDAYYITFNMFPNNQFGGGKACAIDRAKMLTGATATMQCFDTGTDFGGLLASDLDGTSLPPAGSPNYHIALGNNLNDLAFWKFHIDFANPNNSTFVGPNLISVASFGALCNAGTCVTQPGTTQRLDSLADRLMNRFVYRRFADHEALVVSHSVSANGGGGVRWYELRDPQNTTPTVFQQGTFAPDSAFRWMGSIAIDQAGDIALAYATSSGTISPSVRYTARVPSDPPGTMGQGEGIIVTGVGAQTGGLSRYGDYSSLNIDPVDDCTFWYTQEYIGATGSFNWRTRVGSFKLAQCGAQISDFSLTPNPTSRTVAAGTSTTYAVQTAVLSGTAQSISLSISGLPSGVTASFSPSTVTAGNSSTLTVTAAANAPASNAQLTITGTGATATHSANVSLSVTNANQAPTVAITSPANNAIVSGIVPIAATASDPDGTIANVKFQLPDGTTVTDTTAPFSTSWNSATVADGAGHQIRATATDNVGATSTATISVTVQNGGGGCINNTFNATGLPLSIPDNNTTGVTSNLAVTGNGNIASLALSLKITHTFRGDLVVRLTAPGGQQFFVSNRQGGSADNIILTNLAITAFNGTPAAGTWKLRVQDLASIDVGTIDSWSLKIVGDCNPQTHWSGSATPNLPTVDNGSACTSLTVTTTGGSASVTKLDISGRHDWRAILRGTLAHNGVTVTAFPTGTFPIDQGTFSFTNRPISGLSGDASGTWTLCIIDTDAFGDTGVLNTWSVHD